MLLNKEYLFTDDKRGWHYAEVCVSVVGRIRHQYGIPYKQTYTNTRIHTYITYTHIYIHTYIRTYIHYTYNLNEVIPLCIDSIYSLYYIYCSQHNYIIKAQVKATCFDLKVIVRLS